MSDDSVRVHAVRMEGLEQGTELHNLAREIGITYIEAKFEGQRGKISINGNEIQLSSLNAKNITEAVAKAIDIYYERGERVLVGYHGLGAGVNILAARLDAQFKANVYVLNFNGYSYTCQIIARRGTYLEGTVVVPIRDAQGKITGYEVRENQRMASRANGKAYIIIDIAKDRKIPDSYAEQLRKEHNTDARAKRLVELMSEADYNTTESNFNIAARETLRMSETARLKSYQRILIDTGIFSGYSLLYGVPMTMSSIMEKLESAGVDPSDLANFIIFNRCSFS